MSNLQTPPGPEPDNQEIAELVKQVLNGPPDQRDTACQRLLPVIEKIVEEVSSCHCFSRQARNDLIENAPGHVWKNLYRFDVEKGSFEAWCYVVVTNLGRDMGRQQKRRPEISLTDLEPCCERGTVDVFNGLFVENDVLNQIAWLEPFGRGELTQLQQMPSLRRVIVVALAGLAPRVPQVTWTHWLQEANIAGPFPPQQIYEYDNPIERIPCVASSLGKEVEAVRQHWYRGLEVLKKILKYC